MSLGTGENQDEGLIPKNAGILQTKSLMYKLLATHLELDVATFREKLGSIYLIYRNKHFKAILNIEDSK